MKRIYRHIIWLLTLPLMLACEEKDDYYYPSVKLEFVTVKAGDDDQLQLLAPDKGEALPIVEDRTHSSISPGTLKRVLSNYEVVSTSNGGNSARIYSMQSIVSPEPQEANAPAFQGGVKTDPVEVTSIWLGGGYLNLILNIKVKGGKQHILGIVEKSVEETVSERIVTLSLHHDADGDEAYYNRRAYVSIPLLKYHSPKPIRLKFKYHTYGKDGSVVESDKYCDPGFEYIPGVN